MYRYVNRGTLVNTHPSPPFCQYPPSPPHSPLLQVGLAFLYNVALDSVPISVVVACLVLFSGLMIQMHLVRMPYVHPWMNESMIAQVHLSRVWEPCH